MSRIKKENPIVVLVGRVNTGKSTLFNTLTETKQAIVSDVEGTTRDRQYGECLWRGQYITVVDIAGLDVQDPDLIDKQSLSQAEKAIKQADLILFLVDAQAGILANDRKLVKKLRIKNKKNIILVANKSDSIKYDPNLPDFYKLGLGEPIPVSAANGRGTGDLLDIVWNKLNLTKKKQQQIKEQSEKTTIGLIGKPNVGKSSLLNAIAGEERVIVSEKPHTTRDRQLIEIEYTSKKGKKYNLEFIDTAGVRKKNKVKGQLERQGIRQSLETIKETDLVLFITDCSKKISTQDKSLTKLISEHHSSYIIIANKWDLIPEKDLKTQDKYVKYYKANLPYLKDMPILFISSKSGFKVPKLLEMITEQIEERKRIVLQKDLNRFFKKMIKKQPPRAKSKFAKRPFIYEINQVGINPPTFALIVDDPKRVSFEYRRFLLNHLKKEFDLNLSGLKIVLEKRQKPKK